MNKEELKAKYKAYKSSGGNSAKSTEGNFRESILEITDSDGAPVDEKKAAELFEKTAEKGDAAALCELGFCYATGFGIPQDMKKAISCYTKAAEQGNADAQYELGVCYRDEEGVSMNYKTAIKWWKKAAEQKHAGAHSCLGSCYMEGSGVIKNVFKAAQWWKKAAKLGDSTAQSNLSLCYKRGIGVLLSLDKASYWKRKSWETNDEDEYDEENIKRFDEYNLKAENGDAEAQYYLAKCYEKGEGVKRNYEKAFYWFSKSAEQGYEYSVSAMGWMYKGGRGVTKDNTKAKECFGKVKYLNNSAKRQCNPLLFFMEDIGFEDIIYEECPIDFETLPSLIISAAITACAAFTAILFIPKLTIIIAILIFGLSFAAFRFAHGKLRDLLIRIAALCLVTGIVTLVLRILF